MRYRSLAIAAVAACLLPQAAAGQDAPAQERADLIAVLNRVCVAAGGDRARAAELAAADGFSPTPAEAVPFVRNTSERAGFIRSTGADMTYVMLGKMTRRLGRETVTMDMCAVSSRPTDHRALVSRLREVMGFAAIRGGGFDAYVWLQTPEGRAPSRDLSDQQFLHMARTGQMRMVALDRSGSGSTLAYLLPRVD